MIGRIAIENYKSIENLTLDLGRITVLIGANGSGKSNILEAIALCSAAAANKLDNEFLFSRGIRVADDPRHMRSAFDSLNSERDIIINAWMGNNAANQSEVIKGDFFSCILNNRGGDYNYWYDKQIENSIEPDVDETLRLLAERVQEKQSGNTLNDLYELLSNDRKLAKQLVNFIELSAQKEAKEIIYREFHKAFSSTGLLEFLVYFPENSSLRNFTDEGQIQPLGTHGEGLFKLLTVLARDENHDRLAELQERLQLLDWFGDFQIGGNVALGERTLRIRDQYLDGDLAYFTQRSANEGFLFLLFYFALFVAKETPRFFAIDNIDASLNPKLCAELLRQLTELAEKYDKQVILTTHNPAVLDGLNLHDDNQRLYVVERDLDGRTQARRVPAPRPPEKHEEPVPLSEAFLRGYIGGLPKNF